MMTTIMVGMQNSILVVNSSNEYETQESLKETNPQSIAFDPLIDVIQTPLWDATGDLRTSRKRQIAYGVYRSFRRQPVSR